MYTGRGFLWTRNTWPYYCSYVGAQYERVHDRLVIYFNEPQAINRTWNIWRRQVCFCLRESSLIKYWSCLGIDKNYKKKSLEDSIVLFGIRICSEINRLMEIPAWCTADINLKQTRFVAHTKNTDVG